MTTDMTTPPPLPARGGRKRVWILVALLLVPMLVVLGWYITYRVTNASAVRRLEAKVRQRGEPLTLTELAAQYPPIPDEENAAVPLMELWEKEDPQFWRAFRNNQRPLPDPKRQIIDPLLPYAGAKARRISRSQVLSDAQREAGEQWLRENAARAAAVRDALQRPRCRFPVRVTDGYHAQLPHCAGIKREAQSFQIQALMAMERGDVASALSALADVHRAGNTLAEEPFMVGQLVRIACHQIVIGGAEQLLSRRELSDSQLTQLHALLASMRLTNALHASLVAERALALGAFSTKENSMTGVGVDDEEISEEKVTTGMRFLHIIGLAAPDQRLMLETFEQAIALADEETPEALQKHKKLFADMLQEARSFPPKIFSSLLLPALERIPARFATLEARRRAALAAVAVERYRVEQGGQLPAALEVLSPKYLSAVPDDPWNGKPLGFKRLAKGFVVYSVGSNRIDDGGTEPSTKGVGNRFDETFIVER